MEQRCEIILQNYLKNLEYNNDYKIVNKGIDLFIIYYKNNQLFDVLYTDNYYAKYNIRKNEIIKQYKHNIYLFYINNKNNCIVFNKKQYNYIFNKLIYNIKECKYYNIFFNIYTKLIKIYSIYIYFNYYYIIKPYNMYYYIYIYKKYNNNYRIKKLYSNNYSIMCLFI